MIPCYQARDLILKRLRHDVSEAELLQLDQHLGSCEPCQTERARSSLIVALRGWEAPLLGTAAQNRILARLTEATHREPARPSTRRWRQVATAGLFFVAGVAAIAIRHRHPTSPARPVARAPGAVAVTAAPEVSDGAALVWDRPGSASFDGTRVSYRAGSFAVFRRATRTVELGGGELEIASAPSGAASAGLRIVTPRYAVTVVGAHFVVASSTVRAVGGTAEVLDLGGRQLALLPDGATWSAPDPATEEKAPPAPVRHDRKAPLPLAPADSPSVRVGPSVSVRDLEHARSALAAGVPEAARAWIRRAHASASTRREHAAADLLGADVLLVERRRDAAIAAYRRIAREQSDLPSGEVAAFTLAEVLSEHDPVAVARAALDDYLKRYPDGRFVREVRERLSALATRAH